MTEEAYTTYQQREMGSISIIKKVNWNLAHKKMNSSDELLF